MAAGKNHKTDDDDLIVPKDAASVSFVKVWWHVAKRPGPTAMVRCRRVPRMKSLAKPKTACPFCGADASTNRRIRQGSLWSGSKEPRWCCHVDCG